MKITSAEFLTSAPGLRGCPPPGPPEFAFIGRSNVGKSSLINLLVGRRDLAKVSQTPGKTQLINFFSINRAWLLVDLPGYGFAKVAKSARADFNEAVADYLEKREPATLRHTFALIDSRLPPQKLDIAFLGWLAADTASPYSLVFSKADKQSRSKTQENVQRFEREVIATLARPPTARFITSAVERSGRNEILAAISGLL
ncbi:hypothetical protein AXK12_00730 [Cephaloticoccus capnophilus]|uniref:Probable GTP-binding protein EngB n=1 Tax=Cephaloticoccus capnophilus TaxID=1548208 RepID=A0A139SU12_9BACT|nr:ribosome biogenesis GTP-binding protein YihA/YsxC [Cephaloticoccus capnophilus]KXU38063.1 hypothetical protein AXK12_00730 [Cephaloticoccus capnophilus]